MNKRLKLLAVTALLTFILAGCAGQSEKPAVPVEKPTVSVENDTVVPSEETNETDSTISEGNNDIVIPEEPTAVPELTATPEPTATISPTDEPVPTATPVPTVTPVPTATPAPTATPEPTSTPVPTATPEPTATPVPHEHVYTGKVTVDATYEKAGTKTFTCSCGDSYTESIPAIERIYSDDELPVVTDLWEIPLYENPNNSRDAYDVVRDEIKAGKFDKVKFVFSDGEEFRLWNIRVDVEFREGEIASYWFFAPKGKTFSDGYNYHNLADFYTEETRETQQMILGRSAVFQSENADTSGCFGEARINCDDIYRDEVIEVKSETCPVELYKPQLEKYWGYFWHTGLEHEDSLICGKCDYCLAEMALRKLIPSAQESSHHFYGENDGARKILWNGNIYYKRAVIYQ